VSTGGKSTLTITLSNSNAYALTGAALADTLPSGLALASSPAAANSCGGSLATTSSSATLSGGTVPAGGSCTLTLSVSSNSTGTYANALAVNALTTSQGADNTVAASTSLTVTAAKHGGALNWLDLTVIAAALAAARRRRPERTA